MGSAAQGVGGRVRAAGGRGLRGRPAAQEERFEEKHRVRDVDGSVVVAVTGFLAGELPRFAEEEAFRETSLNFPTPSAAEGIFPPPSASSGRLDPRRMSNTPAVQTPLRP